MYASYDKWNKPLNQHPNIDFSSGIRYHIRLIYKSSECDLREPRYEIQTGLTAYLYGPYQGAELSPDVILHETSIMGPLYAAEETRN